MRIDISCREIFQFLWKVFKGNLIPNRSKNRLNKKSKSGTLSLSNELACKKWFSICEGKAMRRQNFRSCLDSFFTSLSCEKLKTQPAKKRKEKNEAAVHTYKASAEVVLFVGLVDRYRSFSINHRWLRTSPDCSCTSDN